MQVFIFKSHLLTYENNKLHLYGGHFVKIYDFYDENIKYLHQISQFFLTRYNLSSN